MLRTILIYGALLAAGSFGLQWLQYRFLVRSYPAEAYLALVALGFLGLGIWVGARLFRRVPANVPFEGNTRAQTSLRISERELFDKLEVRRRTEAILKARELGMIR
jgi:hypothetical protein